VDGIEAANRKLDQLLSYLGTRRWAGSGLLEPVLQARAVLADLYSEAGEEELAAGQRWLASQAKRPQLTYSRRARFLPYAAVVWGNEVGLYMRSEGDFVPRRYCRLPPMVYVLLKAGHGTGSLMVYETRIQAESDLAQALAEYRRETSDWENQFERWAQTSGRLYGRR
jgi:hypothetical protein